MDNFKKQKIIYFFLGGFIVPPIIWFFSGFYLNVFSLNRIVEINLVLPIIYILSNVTVFFFLNKYIMDIDQGLTKMDRKSIFQAQKSISYLPKFYLIALPIYAAILPLSAESDITVFLTFEFFLEWLLGLTLIFISSTPFFIVLLNNFEEAIERIPISNSHKDLDLDSKYFFISIPNIVGTFLVTVSSYLLIFLKNEQNPDLIYILFTKSIVLGIFILGIFGINYYLLRNQILAPILKINDFMNNVILSGGNMNERMTMSNRDQFASIANNFNRLMDFLKESVLQIDDTTIDMVNATKRLNQATKKHGYNTHKENETISDLKKTALQLKNINEQLMVDSSRNIEILNNSHNLIIELNERKSSILEDMDQFNGEIRETLASAQGGEKSLAGMRNNMEALYMIYRDIEEVLDFTNDIAEKINLLSLNASIEAARAGELGIGFSVVAKQIAGLSEDTKKSAIEIQHLLEKSNEKMEESSDQILSGVHTILSLLNGVQEIESDFGRILFNLKEDFDHYKIVENNQDEVKRTEDGISSHSRSQDEKLNYLGDLISNIENFSKTNIESLKELSSTVEHNVHFASDLQKKITSFHLKVPGVNIVEKPEKQIQKKTG